MSHEFRTPLNGVIGMTDVLLDTALDGDQRACAETIKFSGEMLLTILSDIIDFSRIEAGKVSLEAVELSPRSVEGLKVGGVALILNLFRVATAANRIIP